MSTAWRPYHCRYYRKCDGAALTYVRDMEKVKNDGEWHPKTSVAFSGYRWRPSRTTKSKLERLRQAMLTRQLFQRRVM